MKIRIIGNFIKSLLVASIAHCINTATGQDGCNSGGSGSGSGNGSGGTSGCFVPTRWDFVWVGYATKLPAWQEFRPDNPPDPDRKVMKWYLAKDVTQTRSGSGSSSCGNAPGHTDGSGCSYLSISPGPDSYTVSVR